MVTYWQSLEKESAAEVLRLHEVTLRCIYLYIYICGLGGDGEHIYIYIYILSCLCSAYCHINFVFRVAETQAAGNCDVLTKNMDHLHKEMQKTQQ